MILLFVFAFLSGLITIAAPCIWPLLPLVLSTTTTGGHRKPLGITIGICSSFGFFTLFLSYLLHIIPFDPNILRYLAVGIIALLGLTLLIPALSARLEAAVSRLGASFGIGVSQSNGFWSGIATGFVLGIVWTPCAGPILATIATLAATQAVTTSVVLVTVVYIVGVGIPLFFFATFGRAVFTKSKLLSPYLGRIQQVFGIILLLSALSIATNYDKVLEAKLLDMIPSYASFQNMLEGSPNVTKQLKQLKNQQGQSGGDSTMLLNAHYKAPDFVGINHWLNPETPITLQSLRGKVVLVDFWTYSCINCIRTLPHVTAWYNKYKENGFVVIGVHTPEFAFEKDTQNVSSAISQFGIHYPVAQDNDYQTWNAYANQYWPAEYLIDAQGFVRRVHFGEGEYDQTEKAIQALLQESGRKIAMPLETMPDQTPHGTLSPETYFGASRMQYYFPDGSLPPGKQIFALPQSIPVNSFSYGGEWTIASEYAQAGKNAVVSYRFNANNVYVVTGPGSASMGRVHVLLDGKEIPADISGEDVTSGILQIDRQRLYHLVNLHGEDGEHLLQLEFQTPGTQLFTFTFG